METDNLVFTIYIFRAKLFCVCCVFSVTFNHLLHHARYQRRMLRNTTAPRIALISPVVALPIAQPNSFSIGPSRVEWVINWVWLTPSGKALTPLASSVTNGADKRTWKKEEWQQESSEDNHTGVILPRVTILRELESHPEGYVKASK